MVAIGAIRRTEACQNNPAPQSDTEHLPPALVTIANFSVGEIDFKMRRSRPPA